MPVSIGYLELALLFLLLMASFIIYYLVRKYRLLRRNNDKSSDSILNNIQDGVYRTDMDGNMLWCSPSAIKILGTDPSKVDKKTNVNVKDFYAFPEKRNEFLSKLQETGQVTNYEVVLRRADGKHINVSCNSSYWRNSKGEIAGIEGVFRDITAQIEAKKALIESEEKYRSLVEGASEAIFTVNYDGVFLYMNNVAAQRLEGTPDNFIGKTMWDIFPKHIADSQMSSVRKVFNEGIGRTSQTATIIKGKKYSYSTNLQPIKDSSGKISSVLGVGRDITDLVKTQHDLQNERDFVKSLLETANSLIVCMDKFANITVFNKEIEKLTGYSRDEVMGKSWPDIFLPEDHEHHKIDNFEEWVRKHQSDRLEGQIKTKSGELRTILWSNSTLFHSDSDEFTAIAIGLDITDQKIAEQARVESEKRFKESLRYSQAILYRLNLRTNTYDYMSDAVFDITGFTPEEVIAMGADGVNALVHPEDRDKHINYRHILSETDKGNLETHYLESRIQGKDGRYIWSGDSHTLIRDENGEPLYIIGCARDITQHKQMEQNLRRSELLNRKTLDSIDEAIHVIDTDLKVVLINATFLSWCKELGIDSNIKDKTVFELFPFLSTDVRQEYKKVLKTGESIISEEKTQIGNRSIITETRKIPVMDNGSITRIVTIIRDITRQRQAERDRIESEARFLEALENSHDILYRLNLKTNRYDYMSSSVFEITGYTRDEVLAVASDVINSITHPDDLIITGNYREKLIETDQGKDISHTIEYRILHKDGYYIWLGDSHTLIRDSNGEPLYIIGVARDITEQKLTEIRHKARINLLDNLRKANDIDSCLYFGCRAIFEANLFERAVLTMHNDKKEIVNIGCIGLDDATINVARNAPPPDDETLANMTREEFRISNSYFIPIESGLLHVQSERYVPQEDFTNLSYSTWKPGDELFVPIKGISKSYEGWLSVDTPYNRKRPFLDVITLLEETVDIITQKVREIRAQQILKEKHAELAESESKFRSLFEGAVEGILIADPETKEFKYANPAICELLQYSNEELIGLSVSDIHPKEYLEHVFSEFELQSKGIKKTALGLPCLRKDGKVIFVDISAAVINFDGKDHSVGFFNDITERKKIMDELRISEEKYRNLINSNPDPIVIFQDNETKLVNPAFVSLLGYNLEEINSGNGFIKMIHKDDVKKVLIRIQDRLSGKELSNTFSVNLISKDGKEIPCETSVSNVLYQDQPALFITVRDITDRKKMIDDLRQSEKFNQAIIDYSPLGISVRSNTGKLLSYNKTWQKIWGLSDEEILDYTTKERKELIFDERDDYLGKWLPDLKRIYTEGGYLYVSDIYIPKTRRNKENLWVAQHFYAIKDKSGKVERVVILTEDITVRKIAEDKIKAVNQDKLEQAKRIAGTFAHEIRNALFPAAASLNRLKKISQIDADNLEELRKYSSVAERAISRAADITGLISSFTKLDTERMPERVNLNGVVKELLKYNELRLKENDVIVNITGESSCLIRSNRRQLLLAFNNLLLNSIDALSEAENGKIEIGFSPDENGCNIKFTDNGCGIALDDIDKVFEPFFSNKSQFGGTGIGLTMTRRIIEMYGGTISVDSEPEKGTTFNIYLNNFEINGVGKTKNPE